jgi:hypothetical protein
MRNQTRYLLAYWLILCCLVVSAMQLAQAQDQPNLSIDDSSEQAAAVKVDQAELDQMLAPIALYPDTLLSHILVASTYPLEVIQAARWRAANQDLDEQQALNGVEDKDWDPSVQALVPFNDLLQRFSEDLQWLQALGSAFLFNEEQVLSSIQMLRQKAYAQGNLNDNSYIDVAQEGDEIVIQTVEKEVVYVPYYDTRVVYGNWWWNDHQPHYWHRPLHYVFSAGFYWSPRFYIRPSFYFGGFHWRNRHLVADYHYRHNAQRYWSNGHTRHQSVRVREYPRWSHNQQHRRGAQYRVNGKRIMHNSQKNYVRTAHKQSNKQYRQIDKQRIVKPSEYAKNSSQRVKQQLTKQKKVAVHKKVYQGNKNNKQRLIDHSSNQQRRQVTGNRQKVKKSTHVVKQDKSRKIQKHTEYRSKGSTEKRTFRNTTNSKQKAQKSSSFRSSSSGQNKSRPIKHKSQKRQKH